MSRMNLRAGLLCFTSLARVFHARSTGMLAAVVLVVGGLTAAPAFAAPQAATPATARNADDVPEGLSGSDWSSIRQAYEAGRHAAYVDDAVPGHFVARNPGQQWRTRFDGRGFLTTPDAGGWMWGLDLVSYGRGDTQQTIGGTACILTKGTRVEYEWNQALTEWYINDQRGFEHGYTLRDRPEGANSANAGGGSMLHFTLAVRGELVPRVSENGRDVAFMTATDGGGTTALTYNNLKVFDADGVHLAASFQATQTATGTHALRLTIDDSNARYPLTIDPIVQQAYLKAANTGTRDFFGRSVAVSGDTVVVGADEEDSNATGVNGNQADNSADRAGAAYVFTRPPGGTTWTQQAYLKASNTGAGDRFGSSVAISGDTVVIGASGEDSNATGVNGNEADNSAGGSGAVYVFVRSGTTWTQQAYLKASNTEAIDVFGVSVAVSGNTVVVGAPAEDSNATGVNGNGADNSASLSGAAYVFVRSGSTWSEQAYLKASNTGAFDEFGFSVAVSGDTVVVGAFGESSLNGSNPANNNSPESGAAYVFVRSGTTWTQQAFLKAPNPGFQDNREEKFGFSVALSSDTLVVGTPGEGSIATGVNGNSDLGGRPGSGAAYVFVRSGGGTTWTGQAYVKASNTGSGDAFGASVAVSGDTVVVGAPNEDSNATGVNGDQADNSAFVAGAAYVFVRSGTTWTQQAYLKASNAERTDEFGRSVAISGDTVVIGASGEDSNATGVNGDQADNSASLSGAAYVFLLGLPTPASPLASPASVCNSGDPSSLSLDNPGPGIVIDWFTGSCGGTLIGTGNPFNVTPAATTTYYARARSTSDGETSIACASVVVTVEQCCPADLNADTFVDDADFILFASAYNILDCTDPSMPSGCPADLNHDGFVDDADFGLFAVAYDALLCP